ncbi:hypothetical protein AWB71_00782 [Caballeronia peredens]|nr:hypothetical protein AWB71_00782 [Caballeronia peredens]
MEDFFKFEAVAYERTKPVRQGRSSSMRGSRGERQELATGEPIDIYHWAAVALVTALMCAVLGYAAGTPALSRAANVTSFVFGTMGGALMASGVVRSLRARLAAGGRLVVPVVKTH